MSGVDRTPSERVDVCVLGSGVAGALVAHRLASAGRDVVVLEAGQRFDPARRLEQQQSVLRPDDNRSVWNVGGARDRFTVGGDVDYPLNLTRVKGVGGTTLHWLGITPRLHETDFRMASEHGLASDWPIDYETLRPYYAEAETELGVSGAADNPFAPSREEPFPMPAFPPSVSDGLFARACDDLGIAVHSVPQARNSESYDGRSQCVGYSTCVPVCPSGAKYSGDHHVRKAESEGVRVIDRAPVQRLVHDAAGDRLTAAEYATPDGETRRQEARQFVVACGAVETARLLLLSRSSTYPDGLANTSGLVGRYLMEHPTVETAALAPEPANQEPIGFHTRESHQFYDHDEPTPGSIKLEFGNVDPPNPVGTALRGGDPSPVADLSDPMTGDEWGDDLLATLRENRPDIHRRVGVTALVEMLPSESNRVTLDPDRTDDHGNPVPRIDLSFGAHARATMERALEVQRSILDAMGATDLHVTDPPTDPGFAAHHSGTTRMGTDPATSVVDPQCRTHDVANCWIASGSVFVTEGAMNPTLTIAALALRLAETLDSRL